MTHKVTCNDGFVSATMSHFEAKKFARLLEKMGNYDIEVIKV
jgi:hypothetical protein